MLHAQNPVVEIRTSGSTAITSKASLHALYTTSPYIPIFSQASGTGVYSQEGLHGEITPDASNPKNQFIGVVGLGKNAPSLGGNGAYNVGVFGSGKHGLFGKSSESFGFGVYGDGHTGVLGISNTGGIGVQGISYGVGFAGSFLGNVTISERLGIGISGNIPDFTLDVGGRARLRSGGSNETSAGVWFNNNLNNQLRAFIGMRDDNEFGIYSQGMAQWLMRFNVNVGSICSYSTITNCSDIRLKTDISPIQGSLTRIQALNGVNYHWKKHPETSLQTGFIAQEVQKIFPELVETDQEGFLSVNYTGLIPHLLEAIKELQEKNEVQSSTTQSLKLKNEQLEARLSAIEAALNLPTGTRK